MYSMYSMMAILITLFWFVGMLTGIVTTIFVLDLEDKYFFEPVKYLTTEIKNVFTQVISGVLTSSKRAFRIFSTSGAEILRAVNVIQ